MLLGLHTYSFHLHGMGMSWGGYDPKKAGGIDIFKLMDYAVNVGLQGLHVTAVDCGNTDKENLKKIRKAARDRDLYLEFNFALAEKGDPRIRISLDSAIEIAEALGAEIAKVSMDIKRPRPVCASRHHPEVMRQFEELAERVSKLLSKAEAAGVRFAFENHCDCFASEVIWLIKQLNHPCVGACVDTVNSLMVMEDPMYAIEQLVPYSITNHFCDHMIIRDEFGCRVVGVACGDGDIDLKCAYYLIRDHSSMNRINIEVEWDSGSDELEEARRKEREAVEKSIMYCREVLGIC